MSLIPESAISRSAATTVDVLNCFKGDVRLSFDPANPIERERTSRAVLQMLRSGYILFVVKDGQTSRVLDFDPEVCEYIVSDVPAGVPASDAGRAHATGSKEDHGPAAKPDVLEAEAGPVAVDGGRSASEGSAPAAPQGRRGRRIKAGEGESTTAVPARAGG
jgi:hypothetical protein